MRERMPLSERLSWWEYDHFLAKVDYTIIGCGIVGLSTAIELKTANPNSKILIVDKKRLPIGASTKNAGFACFGSISEILDDFDLYGESICQKLIKMRWEGLSTLKDRIPFDKMKYKNEQGAEIFKNSDLENFYNDKISWVNSFVSSIVKTKNCFSSSNGQFGYEIVNKLEGSLNPQLMMNELENRARNLGILFLPGVEIEEIIFDEKYLLTNLGRMRYNKLIICTNGFTKLLLKELDVQPARNQVFITNRIPGFKLDKCYHMNKGYVYFREYEGRLLIGGGRHIDTKGETTHELGTNELIYSYLKDIIQEHILLNQSYEIAHSWSGILGIGDSKMPMVKNIDQDVIIAVRMGGMGVAIGSFIGKVASSMILLNDNSALDLYVS